MSFRGIISDLIALRPGQMSSFVLAFMSIVLYAQIAFYTPRTDTFTLLGSYAILFLLYLILTKSVLSFNFLLAFGIGFRLIFVFSIPSLSDDFYRFFWDGILVNNQINPFLYLPREIMENPSITIAALDANLFAALNSPDYHTVYPPVCQFIFWVSAILGKEDLTSAVMVMKIFMLLMEIGSIILIIKLLKIHKLKRELALLYILNPLVTIELVGNIHFEAFLIFFVLLSVYLLKKNKLAFGAMSFALAIASKLTPILMLPFFLRRLKLKKAMVFYAITLILVGVAFVPFMGTTPFSGLSSSIGLYFAKFEFNASIFYIIREIGFWLKGYNVIQTAGMWLAFFTVVIVVFISLQENLKKQNIPGVLLWALFIYFALATIVHPWYAVPLVVFCLFTKYRFPIVWSFFIFLSYAGYSVEGFQENTFVLIVEYLAVYGVMVYELWKNNDLIILKNPLPEILDSKN